ncbi:hypothetical protein MKX03_026375 [Papaver bracteatum]|nr:hypothetical protein MKX03_026375 [Papaver bracteatum]
MDNLGISSYRPKEKKRKMDSQPLHTRKLRSHHTQISNQLGVDENVAMRDSTKVTGESSGGSNREASQNGCNELPPALLMFHVWSKDGIDLVVDLNSNSREREEQVKASFLGSVPVNVETAGDAKVIESSASSTVRDIPEESGRSSVIIPENLAESSLVMEIDQNVSSLCDNYSQNYVDLSSDSHLLCDDISVVSPGPRLSDMSEDGSKSDSRCAASDKTVPVLASVSCKPDLPIVSEFCEDQVMLITSAIENPGGVIPPPSEPPCTKPLVKDQVELVNDAAPAASQPDMQLDNGIQSDPPDPEPPVEDQVELINDAASGSGSASEPDMQLENGIQAEPPDPAAPVEDQFELVNNSDLRLASEPDIQLDNHTLSEPPCPEPLVEDQVELVNNSASGSASQPNIQLDNGIQSEPPCSEPLVEDQVEVVNISASGSGSQPDIQLDNGIQYGHITSQQSEDPRHQPATKEHAELPSHGVVAPLRAMLQRPISIGRSLGGSGTCVSDSRSMGGVPDSINHLRQSAPMTSSGTSQSLLHHDPFLNESVRIGQAQDQVGSGINSTPQPNTQLDHGIQLGHNTSQQPEFPAQPATTVHHSRLPSDNDALQGTMLQRPMFIDRCVGGSVTRVSDARDLGVVPNCSSNPLQIAPSTSSQTLHRGDPLSNELARVRQEWEQAVKFHKELKMRIRFDLSKELQEVKKKYSKLHQDNESALARRKKSIDTNYNKVFMNVLLAKQFRDKLL